MPETVSSIIASSAKFENSQIDVSPIATLGTLNKVGYTLSLWAKLNGDVVAASPGLKEYIFDGSFNDDLTLIPSIAEKAFLSGSIVPVKESVWTANEDPNFNGGQVNTCLGNKTGTDTPRFSLRRSARSRGVHQSKQVTVSFGTRSDDGS